MVKFNIRASEGRIFVFILSFRDVAVSLFPEACFALATCTTDGENYRPAHRIHCMNVPELIHLSRQLNHLEFLFSLHRVTTHSPLKVVKQGFDLCLFNPHHCKPFCSRTGVSTRIKDYLASIKKQRCSVEQPSIKCLTQLQ